MKTAADRKIVIIRTQGRLRLLLRNEEYYKYIPIFTFEMRAGFEVLEQLRCGLECDLICRRLKKFLLLSKSVWRGGVPYCPRQALIYLLSGSGTRSIWKISP